MGISKFKKGDILRPIEGKKSSNYIVLKDIKEVIVIHEASTTYSKNLIRVIMIDGSAFDSSLWNNYYKNDSFYIYDDAFELVNPPTQDYDIF